MTSTPLIPEAVLRQLPPKKLAGDFDVEYRLKYSGTTEIDKRVMTFIDNLWGIEVTGGADQLEQLTIIAVKRTGLARRAGIRVGDIITQINDTPAQELTLLEAQLEIHESGRNVKLYVKGDEDKESDDENFTECWFKPLSKRELELLEWEKRRKVKRGMNVQIYQGFPWNDKRRPIYKESNCFMVPSDFIEKHQRMVQLKATKEEYLKNLREMANESELHRRLLDQEEEASAEEEFEVLAAATEQQSEVRTSQVRFNDIVESNAS